MNFLTFWLLNCSMLILEVFDDLIESSGASDWSVVFAVLNNKSLNTDLF